MSSIWYAIKYPVELKFPLIEKKNAISYVHAFKNEATFFTAIKWNWKYILDEILFKAPPVYFFFIAELQTKYWSNFISVSSIRSLTA